MANISSIGISSGVLTSDLIDQLANAEREPTELRLDRKEEEVTTKLSDLGRIKSAVTDIRLASRALGNPDALQERSVDSSKSAIGVTATSDAALGSYQLDVTNLAVAHSLSSTTFTDKTTTTVGTGTLSIAVGSSSVDITVDSSNNTLEGLANAINAEDIGATASVIFTGSAYQLVISSNETGTDNAISITVSDNDGNSTDSSGLSQFSFNGVTNNLTESVPAEDAEFTVNGISITRSSNQVDDVIDGLTFSFNEETDGAPATITVGVDTTAITERVQEFVDKYNAFREIINEVTAVVPGGESGSLQADSTVRSINNQIRAITTSIVPGLESADIRSLTEIGISTNKDTGLLNFNSSIFKAALEDHPKDVVALFADQGRASDSQINFVKASSDTVVGSYDIEIDTLATQGSLSGAKDLTAGVTIDANNDTFRIKVNGIESNDIALTAGTYTQANLLTEIQAQLNADTNLSSAGVSVTASYDATNQLVFTSSKFGSASTVEITSIDTNTTTDLGLSVAVGTTGVDVAGKINGVAATGNGRFLTAASNNDASGIKIEITGGTTGSRGQITYIEGIGDQMVDLVNGFLGIEGSLTAAENGFNNALDSIAEERSALEDRITRLTERLSFQFTSADILVGRLNSTRDFLEAQFKAMSGTTDN